MFRNQKVAIISGISGQDGSYLAELLLEKGYFVVGLKRRTSTISTDRIDHLMNNKNFVVRYWSLQDATATYRMIQEYQPDEVYNMAAQSHVRVSFETPVETMSGILMGTAYWLEAIRTLKPDTRFYQASSSEMFGRNTEVPLSEESKMLPASPYACAKLAAHHLVQNYRESYNLFACSGILFNHESPRRGETFVTRKVTRAAARIRLNVQQELTLGNLDAKRDWGYSKDYMVQAWLMLQQEKPDDYVVATGETYTVKDWVNTVFELADIPLEWKGEGVDEVGYHNGRALVKIDPKYFRPQEVPILLGDSTKARDKLNWKPKVNFKQLAKLMYTYDYGLVLEENGGEIMSTHWD